MDPVTHAALGATVGMVFAPGRQRRTGALVGAIAGLLPDADMFIQSAADPLVYLEYHRYFTHAWIFQPVNALVALCIVALLLRSRHFAFDMWAFFPAALVAALSHPFCDLWTSYGTRVYWPFADVRAAWDLVSVMDPLVTVPLLIGLGLALWRPRRLWLFISMGWVGAYLCLAFVQQTRVERAVAGYMDGEGREYDQLAVKPSFGNIIIWRAMWMEGGRVYSAAVRAGSEVLVWSEGASLPLVGVGDLVVPEGVFPEGSRQLEGARRFAEFSEGWIVWHPQDRSVLGDARYAMLPDEILPLWGIGMDFKDPEARLEWRTFRGSGREDVRVLWQMITGERLREE